MPATPRRLLSLAIAAVMLLGACGGGGHKATKSSSSSSSPSTATTTSSAAAPTVTSGPSGFTPEPVSWKKCSDGSGLDCATLSVPLDYSDLGGDRITLGLVRRRARDSSQRIGSLLVNPGGPGGSGIEFVKSGSIFTTAVQDRFDIVGFDPRGVGESDQVPCATQTVDDLRAQDSSPDTPAEQQQLDDAAKALADDCAQHAGTLLPHIGTDDVVRDMDTIRAAVGDDKLTYAGFSYGTLLGLRYLALFPTHARAIYIDGVVDPTQDFVGFLTGQTRAIDARMQQIFDACPAGQSGCPDIGAGPAYDQLAAQVETQPLPADRGKVVDPTALATAAILTTYVESFSATFYAALTDGLQGDGTALRKMADAYYDEGAFASYAGVECIDSPHPVGADAFKKFADDLTAISPRFGGAIANELVPCAFWPVPVKSVLGDVVAPDGPPTLVIGTTNDSATPYEQAVRVAKTLAHGRLVTFDGNQHTSLGASTCTANIAAHYLVDLELPDDGTVCKR